MDQASTDARPYVEGMATIVGVPLVLAVLSIFYLVLFFSIRYCCDSCGGKLPSRAYTRREVIAIRVCVATLVLFLGGLGVIGYLANIGVSQGIDKTSKAADNLVDTLYTPVTAINRTVAFGDPLLTLAEKVNRTVFDVVPTKDQLIGYRNCTDQVLGLTNQTLLSDTLRRSNRTVTSLANMTAVDNVLAQLQVSINALPDLKALANQLSFLNSSLNKLPSMGGLVNQIQGLNSTLSSFGMISVVDTKLGQLDNLTKNFDPMPLANKLTQVDNAFASMPNLTLMGEIVKAPTTSNVGTLLSGLVQLNNSINSMPSFTAIDNDIRGLNDTMNTFRGLLSLRSDITALNTSLTKMPDLSIVQVQLNQVQSFLQTPFGIANMQLAIVSANFSIKNLPSLDIFKGLIVSLNSSVSDLRYGGYLTSLKNQLITFNTSIDVLPCIDNLMVTLRRINTSLVVLPSNIRTVFDLYDTVQDQIKNISKYKNDINKGVSNIDNLNVTLANIPDFNSIYKQINDMNGTVNSLPDLTNINKQILDLNRTLNDIPNISQYTSQIQKLNTSLKIPDLDNTLSNLNTIEKNLNSFPDLNSQLKKKDQAVNATTTMAPLITVVYNYYNSTRSNPQPLQPQSVQDSFLAGLKNLDNSRTNFTDLTANLRSLNSTIQSIPNLANIRSSLKSLNDSLKSFPDLQDLNNKVVSFNSSLGNLPDFNGLYKQLNDLNTTVLSLPSIPDTRKQVQDVDKNSKNVDINTITNQIDQLSKNGVNRQDILKQIDNVIDMRDKLPDVDKMLRDARKSYNDVRDQINQDRRADYRKQKADSYDKNIDLDGYRLIAFHVLMAFPFLVSLCGVCACLCKRGWCSCLMTWWLMFFMFIYFLLAAILLLPSTILVDTCDSSNDLILEQVPNRDLQSYISSIPAELNSNITDVVNYYLFCMKAPPLIANLDSKKKEYTSKFNRSDIDNKLNEFNVTLVPSLRRDVDNLTDIVTAAINSLDGVQAAIQCQIFTPAINNFRDAMCQQTVRPLALYACMIYLLAVCMCPGTIYGILGIKRMQEGADRVDDDDDAVERLVPTSAPPPPPPPSNAPGGPASLNNYGARVAATAARKPPAFGTSPFSYVNNPLAGPGPAK
eukprot:TRINITY_DN5187_c0_g2_i2.p1 TRINITY_DN5187_c0_g2~~TRINITY_DN5187_c0_g2_i2.p1  ORF type:complete len:1241 (+),score=412.93 TRINITY_DN5187_c0_g2_i2:366-3725(+)